MANVLFEQESYKRGMVLGLTMAEIVLLILFTLLLVLSALLIDKEREHEKLVARIALIDKKFSKMVDGHTDPQKFFRELEIAKKRAAQADKLEGQLQEATKQLAELKTTLEKERAARITAERAKGLSQGHTWPPIINLSEAGGYYFEIGSAELSNEFQTALVDRVSPRILQIAAEYPDVDIIEVIGHTDEQTIKRRFSNLDGALIEALKTGDVAALVPADNPGLGMSRAVAVVTQLLQDGRLRERFPRILPMSGAQVIQVDETLSQGSGGDVRERRRIEIRLSKYDGLDTVIQGSSPDKCAMQQIISARPLSSQSQISGPTSRLPLPIFDGRSSGR
jgi:outer membrane protein OmpA-like peptidoglycan-associated protein